MSNPIRLLAVVFMAALAMPAIAQEQDPQKPEKIVLEQKLGSVMTSTGGDYVSADPGQLLVENESMMLTDGAKATVVYYYDNGQRKCSETFKGPNTFVIDDNCRVAGYATGNGATQAGIIAAAALLGAAIVGGGGDDEAPPVSGSSR